MYFIWLALAAFCFTYYIVCAACAGFKSAFIVIWLVGAAGSLAVFAVLHLAKHGMIVIPTWLKIAFTVVMIAGAGWFAVAEGLIISGMNSKPQPGCDYILILGARVNGDTVSKALRQRLDAACEYATKADNQDAMIIVAGGQGAGENVTEAFAMRNYLMDKGIASNRILCEDQSTDTNEHLDYSIRMYIQDASASVVIVSNNFHIYRALKLAHAKGLTQVTGLPAENSSVLFLNNMVREAVGITKEMVFGNF